ncbi:MAG: glycine--tRNA ligase subunit alpha [Elusimicrobiota bacterium]
MNFQDIILKLDAYWAKKGCAVIQPYDMEKGAGTFNTATFFGSLTSRETMVCYAEPCRRPADGRYGENPNRLGKYYQYQVIIKPPFKDIQKIYLESLKAIGIDYSCHDVRWIEDDWESPTLGASGIGWEVWLDGMEVTQFTYFQQMASYELYPITAEITYGLERLAMFSQKKKNVFEIKWNEKLTYGDLFKQSEKQFSAFNFEEADTQKLRSDFDFYEKETQKLCSKGLYYPAYDFVIKSSHAFNLLDARGAISVSERANLIKRVRGMARLCAKAYVEDCDPALKGEKI